MSEVQPFLLQCVEKRPGDVLADPGRLGEICIVVEFDGWAISGSAEDLYLARRTRSKRAVWGIGRKGPTRAGTARLGAALSINRLPRHTCRRDPRRTRADFIKFQVEVSLFHGVRDEVATAFLTELQLDFDHFHRVLATTV